MLLQLEALSNVFDEHIWIKFSDSDLQKAELESQNYSNQTGKNYAYINSLVRRCFIKWMRENLDLGNQQIIVNIPEIWEFVNGNSLTVKNKRLILIPSEKIDMDEFTIPQEWVDIPNWAGDYYVPVQVDLKEKYLHIWGYVSRQTLKTKGDYDPIFRNYYVDADYLIDEMNLLWLSAEICQEKGEVELLGELSLQNAESLINQLSKVSRYSPRLDVDFKQWSKLLNDESLLKRLYQQRLEPQIVKAPINLMKWLENQFDQAVELGWLLVSDYLQKEQVMNISQKVERAKLINLQVISQQKSVVMSLELTEKTNGQYGFLVKAYPYKNKILPANLTLALCLKTGEKLQSVTSTENTNYMKLGQFLCNKGDEVKIEITLDSVTVSENFCI